VENELWGFPPHQGLRVSGGIVWVPHWLTVIVAAVTAASLWIRRRFGLRTLLIATTLVAAGAGDHRRGGLARRYLARRVRM
jgi:hypothetical protein